MKPTKRLPLFIVTGASCAGKSTACEILFREETDYIVLESDVIWNDVYDTPDDDYRAYRQVQLRLCAHIAQAGKPVVLVSGTTPKQQEPLPERALFCEIHYLAVVCDDDTMLDRVTSGRNIADQAHLTSSLHFNRWLKEHAAATTPPMQLLDNTNLTPEETAKKVDAWIRAAMEEHDHSTSRG
ncbi:MAG: ATP-binding protein [Oscillospiraceae bacterium]|jgi:predicted kinase|nr:ATP-binding protein [Oscillospiraceae bacterium]